MNAFLSFLLLTCGTMLLGNCLPYREPLIKSEPLEDQQTKHELEGDKSVEKSPQNLVKALPNQRSVKCVRLIPEHSLINQPDSKSKRNPDAWDFTVVAVPRECLPPKMEKMRNKLKCKFKNISDTYNLPGHWLAFKAQSLESVCKVKNYIKNANLKEKLKNIAHPLRYKAPKAGNLQASINTAGYQHEHKHPKSSHVEKIQSSQTSGLPQKNSWGKPLGPPLILQNFPKIPQLPQLPQLPKLIIPPYINFPDIPANHLSFPKSSTGNGSPVSILNPQPMHLNVPPPKVNPFFPSSPTGGPMSYNQFPPIKLSKGAKPKKVLPSPVPLFSFDSRQLPLSPQISQQANDLLYQSRVLLPPSEKFMPPNKQPFSLDESYSSRPFPPPLNRVDILLPSATHNVPPASPVIPQTFQKLHLPPIQSQPIKGKNPPCSSSDKNIAVEPSLQAPPLPYEPNLSLLPSSQKPKLQSPLINIVSISSVASKTNKKQPAFSVSLQSLKKMSKSQLNHKKTKNEYSKTIKNNLDSAKSSEHLLFPELLQSLYFTPSKAIGPTRAGKIQRHADHESRLATSDGDNTNSTTVLETAGEMASDLAGRVTNLWHCVLGSNRVPHTRDVRFYLYTRRNVIQPELLNVNYDLINKRVQAKPERYDIDCYDLSPEQIDDFERISDENREIIKSNHLNIRAPTKILIHGYTGSYKDSRMAKIKDAYLTKGRYNVIQVDWEGLAAPPCYIRVTHNSKFVGETIAQLLNGLHMVGLNMSLVHLVGFSLGAQVAGFTGNNSTLVPVCRITGLDPALPLFLHTQPSGHLDRLDAKFVDVIHTCGGILAMLDPLGHVDFYPNGGTRQPGCDFSNLKCSHSRAPQYFAESVNSVKKFTGQLCLTWEEYVAGDCDNTSDISYMGDPCSRKSTIGKYYLLTKSKEPFVL